MAQAFDLAGITKAAGAPSFAFLAKGGSRKCPRQAGLITCRQQNQIAHAATPPTPSTSSGQALAKNARMGHPQWELHMRRSPKVGARRYLGPIVLLFRVRFNRQQV